MRCLEEIGRLIVVVVIEKPKPVVMMMMVMMVMWNSFGSSGILGYTIVDSFTHGKNVFPSQLFSA